MIALKNVLRWICSLMHAKLLVALMGAACAGGGRHLPPAFKISCVLPMLILIALHGAAKAAHDSKFYFLNCFLSSCCLFGHLRDHFWQRGLCCCFRAWGCVRCRVFSSLSPALKQDGRCRAKGSQCAPEGFNQLTSQHGNQTCLWIPWEPPSLLTVLSGPQFCMAWIVTGTQSREAPRAAGLQAVATSSGWLIWSGSHQTGHVISQTCIIIISNNGVYSC